MTKHSFKKILTNLWKQNKTKKELDIPRNETKKIRPQSVWVTSRYLNFPYRFGKFLCLTADIFARDPRDARDNQDGSATAVPQRRLKFMIDSGSDTVTVHYDVIRELRLPIKGAVIQEGAGGETQEKPLYSAYLGIGEKTLDIEVTARVFQVRPHSSPTLTFPVPFSFITSFKFLLLLLLL